MEIGQLNATTVERRSGNDHFDLQRTTNNSLSPIGTPDSQKRDSPSKFFADIRPFQVRFLYSLACLARRLLSVVGNSSEAVNRKSPVF